MLKALSGLFSLLTLTCAVGCAETVESRAFPALRDRREPITRIAVAPFQTAGSLARRSESTSTVPPSVATALVTRYVTEALVFRRIEVVPADDVGRALAAEGTAQERLIPRAVAQVAAAKFGADAVLLGSVTRFEERRGQAAGTMHPAAVGFEVTLYTAPGSQKLWSAVFSETQQALSENILSTYRYPGGGMRWLTAEELARWGAEETVRQLPLQ
jgi:curli biogenesis system outer membrane secretion channel CsgG